MNTLPSRFLTLLATAAFLPAILHAAPDKYQVTGPITAMDASTITVMKGGKEKFVMSRDAATKMTGGTPKVGDKVTVQYTITATDVEVKADPGAVKKEANKPAASTPTAPAPAPKPAAAPAGR